MANSGSNTPLPMGWELVQDFDGKVFFVDHNTKTTSWVDPRDRFTRPLSFADCVGDELPLGWEAVFDPKLGTYYVDHNLKTTQVQDPRKQWREQQEKMLKEYLVTAGKNLEVKQEILSVKQQQISLAQEEYKTLERCIQSGSTGTVNTLISEESGSGPQSSSPAAPSPVPGAPSPVPGAGPRHHDPDALRMDVAQARKRLRRLQREMQKIQSDVQMHETGIQTLQQINGQVHYSANEVEEIHVEIDKIKRSLDEGEREKRRMMDAIVELRDGLLAGNGEPGEENNGYVVGASALSVGLLSGEVGPMGTSASLDKSAASSLNDLANEGVLSVADLTRMRLQYDEARSKLRHLQRQLAKVQEAMVPGQRDSDRDRLLLIQEKEQLLRELGGYRSQPDGLHPEVKERIISLKSDLNHALETGNRQIADRLRLDETKSEILQELKSTTRLTTQLEAQLRSLSLSSLSSASSLGSLTSSMGSLASSQGSLYASTSAGHGIGLGSGVYTDAYHPPLGGAATPRSPTVPVMYGMVVAPQGPNNARPSYTTDSQPSLPELHRHVERLLQDYQANQGETHAPSQGSPGGSFREAHHRPHAQGHAQGPDGGVTWPEDQYEELHGGPPPPYPHQLLGAGAVAGGTASAGGAGAPVINRPPGSQCAERPYGGLMPGEVGLLEQGGEERLGANSNESVGADSGVFEGPKRTGSMSEDVYIPMIQLSVMLSTQEIHIEIVQAKHLFSLSPPLSSRLRIQLQLLPQPASCIPNEGFVTDSFEEWNCPQFHRKLRVLVPQSVAAPSGVGVNQNFWDLEPYFVVSVWSVHRAGAQHQLGSARIPLDIVENGKKRWWRLIRAHGNPQVPSGGNNSQGHSAGGNLAALSGGPTAQSHSGGNNSYMASVGTRHSEDATPTNEVGGPYAGGFPNEMGASYAGVFPASELTNELIEGASGSGRGPASFVVGSPNASFHDHEERTRSITSVTEEPEDLLASRSSTLTHSRGPPVFSDHRQGTPDSTESSADDQASYGAPPGESSAADQRPHGAQAGLSRPSGLLPLRNPPIARTISSGFAEEPDYQCKLNRSDSDSSVLKRQPFMRGCNERRSLRRPKVMPHRAAPSIGPPPPGMGGPGATRLPPKPLTSIDLQMDLFAYRSRLAAQSQQLGHMKEVKDRLLTAKESGTRPSSTSRLLREDPVSELISAGMVPAPAPVMSSGGRAVGGSSRSLSSRALEQRSERRMRKITKQPLDPKQHESQEMNKFREKMLFFTKQKAPVPPILESDDDTSADGEC